MNKEDNTCKWKIFKQKDTKQDKLFIAKTISPASPFEEHYYLSINDELVILTREKFDAFLETLMIFRLEQKNEIVRKNMSYKMYYMTY